MRVITLGFESGDLTCADTVVANTNWTVAADAAAALDGSGGYGLRCTKGAVTGSSGYAEFQLGGTGIWYWQYYGHSGFTNTPPDYGRFYLNIGSAITAPHNGHVFHAYDSGGAQLCGIGVNSTGIYVSDSAGAATALYTPSVGTTYRLQFSVSATGSFVTDIYAATSLTSLATKTVACTNPFPAISKFRLGWENIVNKNEAMDIQIDGFALNDANNPYGTGLNMGQPGRGVVRGLYLPTGAGTYTDFSIAGSSPAPTNWQGVDEWPPNDGTDYNLTPASGVKRDSFAFADYAGPNTPRCLTIVAKSACDSSFGSGHDMGFLDNGTIEAAGQLAGTTVGDYKYAWCSFAERAGGGLWTPAAIKAAELLYQRSNGVDPSQRRMTAIAAEIEDDGIGVRRRFAWAA
jgi:hypothetical protein